MESDEWAISPFVQVCQALPGRLEVGEEREAVVMQIQVHRFPTIWTMLYCSMRFNLHTVYIIRNNLWKTQEDNTLFLTYHLSFGSSYSR